jgi:putative ABC transport system substrate-binding protein
MRRRDFIKVMAGSAGAWPLVARAQQRAMPVIGFLSSVSPQPFANYVAGFRAGLKEAGYIDGQNVTIEFHTAPRRAPACQARLRQRSQ